MLTRILATFSLLALAACGADGAPETPAAQAATKPGLTISGCVKAGVTAGPKTIGGPTRC